MSRSHASAGSLRGRGVYYASRIDFDFGNVALVTATLLSVLGVSSSAGVLPGRPASPEVLEKTTARMVGTCTPTLIKCTMTYVGANYCQTTYGAPAAPFGSGGCTSAGTGVTRPCGSCTGGVGSTCVGNAASTFKCCGYTAAVCCPPTQACATSGTGCACVTAPGVLSVGANMVCYSCPKAFATPPSAPCTP